MFTGIIEETGTVRAVTANSLCISAEKVLEGTAVGDSIAVNGVCLTVTSLADGAFTADVMPETVRLTSLARLRPGAKVNLERAMQPTGRLGGHIVSGHVDGCGRVDAIVRDGIANRVTISLETPLLKYIARKGSVTVDGVSLTVWANSGRAASSTSRSMCSPATLNACLPQVPLRKKKRKAASPWNGCKKTVFDFAELNIIHH